MFFSCRSPANEGNFIFLGGAGGLSNIPIYNANCSFRRESLQTQNVLRIFKKNNKIVTVEVSCHFFVMFGWQITYGIGMLMIQYLRGGWYFRDSDHASRDSTPANPNSLQSCNGDESIWLNRWGRKFQKVRGVLLFSHLCAENSGL